MKQHWVQYWNDLEHIDQSHWEAGGPDHNLATWFQQNSLPARVLEIGCGTGTDSIWMAAQGSEVSAIDVSTKVLSEAQYRAQQQKVNVEFIEIDIVNDPIIDKQFDLIYDRGCFHLYNVESDRVKFVQQISKLLKPTGVWLSLNASVESWDPTQPGRSAKPIGQIVNTIEPYLQLTSIKSTFLENPPNPVRSGWAVLSQLRTRPPAPWTNWPG
jgi:methyl halide transferase